MALKNLRAAEVPAIGHGFGRFGLQNSLRPFGHIGKLRNTRRFVHIVDIRPDFAFMGVRAGTRVPA
jgi:hypothetical protein